MEGHWQVVQNKKDRKWDKKGKDLRDSCNMQSSMQGMQNLRRNKVLTKGRVCELGKQTGLSKALGPKVKFVPKWINFVFSSGQPNDVIKGVFGCDFFGKKIIFFIEKSVFIYLDNFLKIIRISKKIVFNFFVEAKRVISEKKSIFNFFSYISTIELSNLFTTFLLP